MAGLDRTHSEKFLRAVQARAARVAITASATRGQKAPGVVERVRDFCVRLDLKQFSTTDRVVFKKRLDKETDRLVAMLPRAARRWGVSRKLLNIFLRDCLYTQYLANYYRLNEAEEFFEVPLDSISGKACIELKNSVDLPKWPGVRYMNAPTSALYQGAISVEAARRRITPVHLDTFWWGERTVRGK